MSVPEITRLQLKKLGMCLEPNHARIVREQIFCGLIIVADPMVLHLCRQNGISTRKIAGI
jgi:hypothetical protein